MPRPKIVDRSSVEILLDDGRADVRPARYGRRISEPLAHGAHRRCDDACGLRLRLGNAVLGERDRGEQRPAPRAEILGGEVLANVALDVLVQAPAGEGAQLAVAVAIAEEPAATLFGQKLSHRVGELRVDESRPDEGA